MTTEQMKELYASGDWICICYGFVGDGRWFINNNPNFDNSLTGYKLIHKKHKEVLDHVLAGGKVECTYEYENPHIEDVDGFIKYYHEDNTYRIIKEKQSLNGKYCLATKAHCEQLVKDGYEVSEIYQECEFILIAKASSVLCGKTICTNMEDGLTDSHTPMHYNEEKECWVFGSLESDGTLKDKMEALGNFTEACKSLHESVEKLKPKQVESITKYIYHYSSEKYGDYVDGILTLDSEILTQDRLREIKCLIWKCDSYKDIKITSLSLLKTITLKENQVKNK